MKRERIIAVIGMGYVGLPMAMTFAKKYEVIGFDINQKKIERLKNGIDETKEVRIEDFANTNILFTSDESELDRADFYIVAVPTPVDRDHVPENTAIIGASEIVGRHLKQDDYVVYESTVYPGMTEELCLPILEKHSGLKLGSNFKLGYSPERINPGDHEHTFQKIVKVVSGSDDEALETIAEIYGSVVSAGIYKAENIRVAEAAKVIENTQRDINIAFMNELSILFHRMGIDTRQVLNAASTKWNFLNFQPGLVGGHCIGVDPYYLTYKAEQIGYHPQIILSGRLMNDGMGPYVAHMIIKTMIKHDINVKKSTIGIFGVTFKENCPDTRNSKVFDIIKELKEYGVTVRISDRHADPELVEKYYQEHLEKEEDIKDLDGIVIASCHREYETVPIQKWKSLCKNKDEEIPFFDLKGRLNEKEIKEHGFDYWRL